MSNPETPHLQLGGLYRSDWDSRLFRIIGIDAIEVFYDCLWSDNNWTFSGKFKKKVHFYRIAHPILSTRSELIEIQPLTPDEYTAFRPDLPLRLGRTKMLSWNNFECNSQLALGSLLRNFTSGLKEQKLQTDKIMLLPYGSKGGLKKGTLIYAENGQYFPIDELLLKANQIQELVNGEKSTGIGIYRLGFEKSTPSYYIGEYFDQAGICKV